MTGFTSRLPVRCRQLLLAGCTLLSLGSASAETSLEAQLAEIGEIANFVPEKALKQLARLDQAGRSAAPDTKAEYLTQLSLALRGTGQQNQAIALADEAITLGKARSSPAALAKGLLAKGEIMLIMNELDQSHQLIWESERVATATTDLPLRIQASVRSGQAYAEDGNFPEALTRLQAAVALARQHGNPVQMIRALNGLARLYRQMKDYDKSFDTLKEAMALATDIKSPARMASLLNTEYLIAMDTAQPARGLRALLSALELQRQIGDTATIDITLVNLSDSYLKVKDYRNALSYATQAIEAARHFNDEAIEATAHVNIGEAQLGMGRLAESKRSFETGLMHPFSGLDHLLAMIAVGLWAVQAGGRNLLVVPAAFVIAMALGTWLGIAGGYLPLAQEGIAASVVMLGLLVAFAVRGAWQWAAPLVSVASVRVSLIVRRATLTETGPAALWSSLDTGRS